MRILVTGGAGFIGSNLVQHLLSPNAAEKYERVVTLDALSYAGNLDNLAGLESEPRHVFIKGSINDQELVAALLREHQVTHVMHLAAESHVDRSIDSPEPFIETNIVGTLRLLQACRSHFAKFDAAGQRAFRFLHVSTDEVFGSLGPSDPPFHESTPYDPRSPYAASKAGSDHLVRACAHTYGLPVLVTNSSNNYGPRQFPEKLIPLTILSLLEDRPVPIYGDGLQRRDWLYVADHCRALELVLRQGRTGETYAIGGEAETANIDIVHAVCALLDELAPRSDGRSHTGKITHVTDRPGHDRRYAMSIAKIKSELGWQPREKLASGLRQTILWYLENRAWCRALFGRIPSRERPGRI